MNGEICTKKVLKKLWNMHAVNESLASIIMYLALKQEHLNFGILMEYHSGRRSMLEIVAGKLLLTHFGENFYSLEKLLPFLKNMNYCLNASYNLLNIPRETMSLQELTNLLNDPPPFIERVDQAEYKNNILQAIMNNFHEELDFVTFANLPLENLNLTSDVLKVYTNDFKKKEGDFLKIMNLLGITSISQRKWEIIYNSILGIYFQEELLDFYKTEIDSFFEKVRA